MSDSNSTLSKQVEELSEADRLSLEHLNSMKAATASVKLRLDPIELINQVQQMRQDGVEEATVRAAFEQAIEQVQGKPRKNNNSMKAHRDAPNMPTQEEINEIYEKRYSGRDIEIIGSFGYDVTDRLQVIEDASQLSKPKLTYRAQVKIYILKKLLRFTIFVCKSLGVK